MLTSRFHSSDASYLTRQGNTYLNSLLYVTEENLEHYFPDMTEYIRTKTSECVDDVTTRENSACKRVYWANEKRHPVN